MISKASAPAKIILFGEHFVVYDVKAILATINKRITVTSETTAEPTISIQSQLGDIKIGILEKNTIPELRPFEFLAKKMIKEFSHKGGIKIQIESDIPYGVGLGSSAAACVASAASISGLFTKYSKDKICKLAIEAEKTIFENTSGADCTVCTFGGIIEYDKSGYQKIKLEPDFNLVIVNSEIIHRTKDVVSKVLQFKNNNAARFEELCVKESEIIRKVKIAIEQKDYKALGSLIKENQVYLKEIGVSNDTLDGIIQTVDKTSYGSKITGAGGGGCIISIAEESAIDDIIRKLDKYQIQCFAAKIDYRGLETF